MPRTTLKDMDKVTVLSTWKAARAARARVELERDLHPSLRWVAGDAWWEAHSRTGPGASCGAPGPLVLAPPGVPLCADCYPDGGFVGQSPSCP